MFDLDEAISNWRTEMIRAGIKQDDVLAELEGHLREHFGRLTASGIPADEAFASATRQLGDSQLLKREFSKVSRLVWSIWRENPAMLNVLALWFIVAGSNAAGMVLQMEKLGMANNPILTACVTLMSSQLLIGLGLLYRWRFSRYGALGWAGLEIGLFLFGHIYSLAHWTFNGLPLSSLGITVIGNTTLYYFLNLPLPIIFLYIFSYFNLTLMAWACYFLTRPGTKSLFHSRKAYV
jgi:hypothetical protein